MGVSWETLLEGNVRTLIEREALAPFLLRQRWFAGKARQLQSARFVDWGLLRRGDYPMFLTIVEAEYKDGRERYVIPLTILSNDSATRLMTDTPSASLARVTGARKGVIADGSVDDEFAVAILHALEQEQVVTNQARSHSAASHAGLRGSSWRGRAGAPSPRARTEQHVDHVRRPSHRQGVPARRSGAESRRRDRRAPHDQHGLPAGAARGRRVRIPPDR